MAADEQHTTRRLAEEYFASEDGRFVFKLREVADAKWLAGLTDRWRTDPRPWARRQQFAYLRLSPDAVGHQPVVKRLFKQAEERGDHELVGAFAVLFDRLVRHERKTRWSHDWEMRTSEQEEFLAPLRPALPYSQEAQAGINPFTGEKTTFPAQPPMRGAVYFSAATRYYLQRRAWRYFRHLAFRDPTGYVAAAAAMLKRYEDEHLAKGENLLDSWTLLQCAFRNHAALDFGRERIRLADGHSLGELRAAPRFLELWQTADAFDMLLSMLDSARSRLVRVWAIHLMEDHHESTVAQLPADKLLALLASSDADVQEFAARLLKNNQELGRVPVATWLALVEGASPTALESICEAMRKHVAPERFSLPECAALATGEPAPVAQLGFDLLRQREVLTFAATLDGRRQVARLAGARCDALADEMADWALAIVGGVGSYDRDLVLPFFDSVIPAIRERAWEWLEKAECPGRDDPVLFCRLMETPFDDIRLRLVDLLERRRLPGEATSGLIGVWSSVLLGVERGGRQKLKATRQLAEAVTADPSLADKLLPVLATAVRSVRRPEARAGLAAAVSVLTQSPRTAEAVARHLPELEIVEAGAPT